MQYRTKQAPGLSVWLSRLLARTHQNVAVVALANKLLRMAWAVLCKNEKYQVPVLPQLPEFKHEVIPCQVCWRITEMAQRSNRRFLNLTSVEVLQDRLAK